jgi:hypothetical protein
MKMRDPGGVRRRQKGSPGIFFRTETVMRLNHLDFHVPDIAATADFLIRHFGLRLKDMRGQNGLAILEDDAGLEIVLSHAISKFGTADLLRKPVI